MFSERAMRLPHFCATIRRLFHELDFENRHGGRVEIYHSRVSAARNTALLGTIGRARWFRNSPRGDKVTAKPVFLGAQRRYNAKRDRPHLGRTRQRWA